MFRLLVVNVRKSITDKSFYACVLMVFALCFTATISHNAQTGDPENILFAVFHYDNATLLSDVSFNAFAVFQKGGEGWLAMFIPIIAAFSFMSSFYEERQSKFIRYCISRTKKLTYHAGNFISALLSGGAIAVIGYILFGIVIRMTFPPMSEYTKETIDLFNSEVLANYGSIIFHIYSTQGIWILYAISCVEMFLFGAMAVLPAFVLSAVIRNKYLILCIPFFLYYVLTQLSARLYGIAYADIMNPDEALARIGTIINPLTILSVLSRLRTSNTVLVLDFVLLISAFLMFHILMNRRLDSGE